MDCPLTEKCSFFTDKLADMPVTSEKMKRDYCKGKYQECARYQVKQKTGQAHPNLMPNETNRIDAAIKELTKK